MHRIAIREPFVSGDVIERAWIPTEEPVEIVDVPIVVEHEVGMERIGRINGIFTPPPGRTPLMFAGDHCLRSPLHAPPARRGSPLERPAPQYHAAWTGRSGWGRLQPQGCPRARASG